MSAITPNRDAKLRAATSQTPARPRTRFELDFPPIQSLTPMPKFKKETLQPVQAAPPEMPTPGNQLIRPQAPVHQAGTSASWVSTNTQNQARLRRLQGLAAHSGFLKSPFFPKSVMDYTLHLTEWQALVLEKQKKALERRIMAESEKECSERKLAAWGVEEMEELGKGKEGVEGEKVVSRRKKSLVEEKPMSLKKKVGKCLGGRQLENTGAGTGGFGLTTVLAKASIWVPGVEEGAKVEWPGRDELKFHGQERTKRGLSRRLPHARTGKLDPREKAYILEHGGLEGQAEVDLMNKGQTDVPWRKREAVGSRAFDKVRVRSYGKANHGIGRRELNVAQEKAEAGEYGLSGCIFDEKKLRQRTGWSELLDEL